MSKLKTKVKQLIKLRQTVRYHKAHTKEASKILNHLSTQDMTCSRESIDKCDEYAMEVLGSKNFAPWLYVYTAVAGSFKEGWIPDNYYGVKVVPALAGDYGIASSLGSFNNCLFRSPHFPDLASLTNGLIIDRDYNVIDLGKLRDLLFSSYDRVVFKADRSGQGLGVRVLSKESFGDIDPQHLGNGLFQAYIDQHDSLAAYTPDSVSTLRITTVVDLDGVVSARTAYARFSMGDDKYVRSKSSVRVPIDLDSGVLWEEGFTGEWTRLDRHPNNQKLFGGFEYPQFDHCLEIVKRMHSRVPFVRVIGWDVVVDRNGDVKVMEWNAGHNDIKFSEATQGPCFAEFKWEHL